MREKIIELTMQSGAKFYLNSEDLNSFGVPETPDSYVGNYLTGSRGPMMRVKTATDATAEDRFINPGQIESMKVTYLT